MNTVKIVSIAGNNPTTKTESEMVFKIYELIIIGESKLSVLPVGLKKKNS